MKEILLTQGQVAVVDDADYEGLAAYKWHAQREENTFYAKRNATKEEREAGAPSGILMHAWLLQGRTDHIDGDGLNNQRGNLRLASHRENLQGFQTKRKGCSSRYRGVCRSKESGKWKATIRVSGKNIHLGYHEDESAAAGAYDLAAQQKFGAFAARNFPEAAGHTPRVPVV